MTETTTTRLSLDVDLDSHGCDELFTEDEIAEAGGLEALKAAYREHHIERIMDVHSLTEVEAFERDIDDLIKVTVFKDE